MKKIIVFILIAFALLFAARQILMPKLVERGFNRLVSENVGVDRSAALEDGLHVYICGAGSPLPDPKRSGPCIGILAGQNAFVFDAGTGGARNLGPMGFPIGRIDTIFLTHLHSDHLDGLGEMLLGHHGVEIANPAGYGGAGQDIELEGDSRLIYDKNDVKITVFKVSHEPVFPAFGYRVDYKGRSISISGDTAYDPKIAAAHGDGQDDAKRGACQW